jgi:hypothetical protein
MKNAMVFALLVVLAQGLLATDIHSTTGGGNWFDITTWVGGSVPQNTDNVFIHGKVTAADHVCNNLTILNGGQLLNYRYGIYTVTVNGNLNNAGIIMNNDMNYLSIAALGNVTNTGVFSAQYLYFSGSSPQYLSSSVNMSTLNLIDTVSTSSVILQSDVALTNSMVNMNNATLVLNGSSVFDLSMSGGYLNNAVIQGGNGATLTMGVNCYLNYVSANALTLEGTVIIADGVSFGSLYNNATIYNYVSMIPTLNITQRLENHGTIRNNPSNNLLYVNLGGDLYNYGTISNYKFTLNNTEPANLFQSAGCPPISSEQFYSTSASGDYQMLSHLRFLNSNVYLFGKEIGMHSGSESYGITVIGGYLQYLVLEGDSSSYLTLGGNAYLQYLTADEIILNGTVIIAESVSIGNLVNNATVYNYISNVPTLNITQRLENHGTIRDNLSMNILYINLGGDLYNYGTISNNTITISGASLHNIYQDSAALPFTCGAFTVQSDSGTIQMLSDLRFSNCNLYLGGKTMLMFLDSSCFNLNIEGGYLYFAILDTNGFSTLDISAGAYLDYVTAEDIILRGIVIIVNNVVFDDVVVYGTVYNYQYGTYSMDCNGNLVNYGTIRNNPSMNSLYVNLRGDLYNYNTMSNNTITFTGLGSRTEFQVHHVYQDAAALPFTCVYFTVQSDSGNLQLLSDLRLSNCAVNLNGKTMQMYMNRSCYGLKLEGGYLYYAVLDTNGFCTLEMSAGAYMDYITAEDIILRGTIIIANSVVFDDVVVYGTVYNHNNNVYSMVCNGNLVNYGTIRNHPGMNWLYLYCRKDLSNYGIIQSQQTLIDGAADQYVLIGAGSSIACPAGFNLVSEIGAAQWYFNGSVNNTNYYPVLTVTPSDLGVWQPFDGTNFGRHIILGNGLPVTTPQSMVIFPSGTELKLQWSEVDNATFYTIYVSSDPYGTYIPLATKAFDSDLTDGIVWMDIAPSPTLRFYKVSAGN